MYITGCYQERLAMTKRQCGKMENGDVMENGAEMTQVTVCYQTVMAIKSTPWWNRVQGCSKCDDVNVGWMWWNVSDDHDFPNCWHVLERDSSRQRNANNVIVVIKHTLKHVGCGIITVWGLGNIECWHAHGCIRCELMMFLDRHFIVRGSPHNEIQIMSGEIITTNMGNTKVMSEEECL
jgi:hypothetical protein